MSNSSKIASQLGIRKGQVTAVIQLLDDGNTVPFIARYRKEATGELSDEQVQAIATALQKVRAVDERRDAIRKRLVELELMTADLDKALRAADTLTDLEDIYAPYRPKRQTRASVAREMGLEPLARLIAAQPVTDHDAAEFGTRFINPKAPTIAHVWTGARDIVAEMIADHADVRRSLRRRAWEYGRLHITRIDGAQDPQQTYKLYYDYTQVAQHLKPHQILAINRGEKEKVLRVQLAVSEHDLTIGLRQGYKPHRRSPLHDQLVQATEDATQRLLMPAIERDVRRMLTEAAEKHAIDLFAENLRQLLSQPPLTSHTIMGIDPAYRTGCKVAVIDPTGKVTATGTIYPHKPRNARDEALSFLVFNIRRHGVSIIAIGNGTASRETEQLVAELTRAVDDVKYLIVDESGASVYSASALARNELPDLDVTLRGAVSIARRVQDPLAELVKIDPKSIGVGMYQHDVNQAQLSEALGNVVALMVNRVGVDVNTASPALLTHVAGIGPRLAEKIVAHRDANGPFSERASLLDVSGLGPKTFEQSAGFLRIRDGANPLDASAIHPESYPIATALLERAEIAPNAAAEARQEALDRLVAASSLQTLAADLGTGVPTLQDIIDQIVAPGRDPRTELPPPLLRSDVLSVEDLTPGLRLHGTVRNIVDFGAFIDIGVKRDGLLHRTQIPKSATLHVGAPVEVVVRVVDTKRGRIDLGWPT